VLTSDIAKDILDSVTVCVGRVVESVLTVVAVSVSVEVKVTVSVMKTVFV